MTKARILDLSTNEYSIREEPEVQEAEFRQGQVRELEATIEPPQLFRKALHGPFKSIDLERGDKKSVIQGISLMIPLNELDLPLYIYRPDLLDEKRIVDVLKRFTAGEEVPDEMREITGMLDASGIQLDYVVGYPTMPNGKALWEQFEFETADAYAMFAAYLNLDGLRKLSELRSFPMHFLQEFYHTHYWVYRARAFDLYRAANAQKQKINRMLTTEDKHFRTAEKFMNILEQYIDQVDIDDLVESMDPKDAVAMLEKLVSVQRISIGLPKSGEAKEKDGQRAIQSPHKLLQDAAGSSARSQDAIDEAFEDLLEDPESIALAQDLILNRQSRGKMD